MRRRESEDALTRITYGIFRAVLTLQAALDQPADVLRQAAEHTLDLLDETAREARDAAFTRQHHAAVLARSGSIRTRSREASARTLELVDLSAATHDRVAATLGQLATSNPRHSAGLQQLRQAAASHAIRLRQWAHDHAATA